MAVRRLAPADSCFRRMLAASRCLPEVVSAGVEVDPVFDLPAALTALLGDTIVVGFGIEAMEGAPA